jgi:hypothetical protein
MHWVIQSNIYAEEGFEGLLAAIKRLNLTYTLVKVIPFVGGLEVVEGAALPENGADAIVLGSYTLARVARKERNWHPGAFLANLDFEIQRQHWGDRMLNFDAKIYKMGAVPEQEKPFFLRPVHDTKAFTGMVCDYPYYQDWVAGLKRMPETADPVNDPLGINLLDLDTPVMVCTKKEIWSETRVWMLPWGPVTSSGYKIGTIKRYQAPELTEPRVLEFAHECHKVWHPNDAYVLDVADTSEGLKIVEVNNLNSAGFYKGDMLKLLGALEAWAEDGSGLCW